MDDADTAGETEHYERALAAARRIEEIRKRVRPKLSIRAAAEKAGISEGWWRQVVLGVQQRGDGTYPVNASDETLLDMARVVGIQREVAEILGIDEVPPESDDAEHRQPRSAEEWLTELRRQREQPGADIEDIDFWIRWLEFGLEQQRRQTAG